MKKEVVVIKEVAVWCKSALGRRISLSEQCKMAAAVAAAEEECSEQRCVHVCARLDICITATEPVDAYRLISN